MMRGFDPRRIIFGGLLVLFFATLVQPAQAGTVCTKAKLDVKVKVKLVDKKVSYTGLLNRRQITKRATQTGLPAETKNSVLGLTVAKPVGDYDATAKTRPLSKGVHCAYPKTVTVKVGYDSIKVYVAKEYRKGSCEWYAVRKHEDQHVRIFRKTLKAYFPAIKKAVKKEAKRLKVFQIKNKNLAADTIAARIAGRVGPILQKVAQETKKKNAAIDTRYSYLQVAKKCKRW